MLKSHEATGLRRESESTEVFLTPHGFRLRPVIANFLNQQNLSRLALAFVLLRVFDIIKVFPLAKPKPC
jgi:hypothetical protein